jgi:hypothetical protein
MNRPPDIEYKVVLVFPGYGSERESAEEIIEAALEHLNTQKDEPGFRFTFEVFARLEIVPDLEQAQALLDSDDSVVMMILHGLDDEERIDFTIDCGERGVSVCRTVPAPDEPPPPRKAGERRPWQIVFRERSDDDFEPRAHTISETTLTGPLEDNEEVVIERVQQLIAVMALGVMEQHWKRKPPQRPWLE